MILYHLKRQLTRKSWRIIFLCRSGFFRRCHFAFLSAFTLKGEPVGIGRFVPGSKSARVEVDFLYQMQFVVIGRDGDDEAALSRRMAAREAHLQQCAQMQSEGRALYAAGLFADDGRMNGSVMVVDFASRSDLDDWLAREPYVLGDVWRQIEVVPCAVAPIFA